MKLNRLSIEDTAAWKKAGVKLPSFDVGSMIDTTLESPVWLHFGAGNIFRGFIARLQQELLEKGMADKGILAADTFDYGIIDRIYRPHDNLTLLVSLNSDGTTEREVIASVAGAYRADVEDTGEEHELIRIFTNSSLQMVSFTITEKGYSLYDMNGNLLPTATRDLEQGPRTAHHAMALVAFLMYMRYLSGAFPIALVSMDNCSHNGEKLRESVLTFVNGWRERGYVDQAFVEYMMDETQVSFPWSMIDKITPRPSESVFRSLSQDGIEGMDPVITTKGTFIAPFVNAETPQYLVIEDKFPNGRPLLEQAGVYMTDRKTVNDTERMKVTTCLNPLHTALAVYGCLLGYTRIADEMNDPDLRRLAERIGYDEGMPVVTNPGIIDPGAFLREVLEERLPNAFLPDAPQRIATDTSQKVSIRFGETIKSYCAMPGMDVTDLTCIPLVIAGWFRYLLAVDDKGEHMELSSDPMLPEFQSILSSVRVGNPDSYTGQLRPILSNASIFAVNLVQVGLADKIESMFCTMIKGPGAVRDTLKYFLNP